MTMLVLILGAELYFNYSTWLTTARLTWPYGDQMPGNYLARLGLIAAVGAIALAFSDQKAKKYLGVFIACILLIFTSLTGERINTLLVLCSMVLSFLWIHIDSVKKSIGTCLAFISVLALVTLFFTYVSQIENCLFCKKFTSSLIHGLLNFEESGYIHLWKTGLAIFEQAPLTGIGTGSFRFLCETLITQFDGVARCDNHPHQFYIQVLAETGIIGFCAFALMVISIVGKTWQQGRFSSSPLIRCCFVVPFALFFPIQSSPDVFGQWANSMMWFGIALAMAISSTDRIHPKQR
jgi:O-antigen ligase